MMLVTVVRYKKKSENEKMTLFTISFIFIHARLSFNLETISRRKQK